MPGKFVARYTQGGEFHVVLKAENGQVVATSETDTMVNLRARESRCGTPQREGTL
jgi:hypothetical protein